MSESEAFSKYQALPEDLKKQVVQFMDSLLDSMSSKRKKKRVSGLAKDKIFIKDGEKCHFVPISKIFLFESEGNYVRVFFENQQALLHKSLTYMEQKMPEELFFRANRQFMFNLDFIDQIEPYFNSTLLIVLKSGHKIDLSQRQSAKFREITGV